MRTATFVSALRTAAGTGAPPGSGRGAAAAARRRPVRSGANLAITGMVEVVSAHADTGSVPERRPRVFRALQPPAEVRPGDDGDGVGALLALRSRCSASVRRRVPFVLTPGPLPPRHGGPSSSSPSSPHVARRGAARTRSRPAASRTTTRARRATSCCSTAAFPAALALPALALAALLALWALPIRARARRGTVFRSSRRDSLRVGRARRARARARIVALTRCRVRAVHRRRPLRRRPAARCSRGSTDELNLGDDTCFDVAVELVHDFLERSPPLASVARLRRDARRSLLLEAMRVTASAPSAGPALARARARGACARAGVFTAEIVALLARRVLAHPDPRAAHPQTISSSSSFGNRFWVFRHDVLDGVSLPITHKPGDAASPTLDRELRGCHRRTDARPCTARVLIDASPQF